MKRLKLVRLCFLISAPFLGQSAKAAIPDTAIQPLSIPNPENLYPADAKKADQQGVVRVKLCIGKESNILSVDVSESSGYPLLDAAAIRVAAGGKYLAATKAGSPIDMCANMPVSFILDRGVEPERSGRPLDMSVPTVAREGVQAMGDWGGESQTVAPANLAVTSRPTGNSAAGLKNADVIAMVGSGIPDNIIQAKIKVSACAFDTSPESLRQLKLAKVSDAVVIEMINRSVN